jgi:hypothetical protein
MIWGLGKKSVGTSLWMARLPGFEKGLAIHLNIEYGDEYADDDTGA